MKHNIVISKHVEKLNTESQNVASFVKDYSSGISTQETLGKEDMKFNTNHLQTQQSGENIIEVPVISQAPKPGLPQPARPYDYFTALPTLIGALTALIVALTPLILGLKNKKK